MAWASSFSGRGLRYVPVGVEDWAKARMAGVTTKTVRVRREV